MHSPLEYLSSIESKFKQFRKDIWIDPDLSTASPIFRYTSFENLLSILNGDIYLPKRSSFTDRRERGEYQSDKILCMQTENILAPKRNEITRRNNNAFKLSTSFPVSCWTLNRNESYLMWRAYTPNSLGVRLETTIENFIDAFQINTGQKIYCSCIHYEEEKYPTAPIDILFYKDMGYCMESEVRFYVVDDSTTNDCEANGVYFLIHAQRLLKSVTLSPLISPKSQNDLYKLIAGNYKWLNLNCSEIMEYQNNVSPHKQRKHFLK